MLWYLSIQTRRHDSVQFFLYRWAGECKCIAIMVHTALMLSAAHQSKDILSFSSDGYKRKHVTMRCAPRTRVCDSPLNCQWRMLTHLLQSVCVVCVWDKETSQRCFHVTLHLLVARTGAFVHPYYYQRQPPVPFQLSCGLDPWLENFDDILASVSLKVISSAFSHNHLC